MSVRIISVFLVLVAMLGVATIFVIRRPPLPYTLEQLELDPDLQNRICHERLEIWDSLAYKLVGLNFTRGEWMMWRRSYLPIYPPGHPLVLGVVLAATSHSMEAVKTYSEIMVILSGFLIFLLWRRYTPDAAYIALIILSSYPLVDYSRFDMSEHSCYPFLLGLLASCRPGRLHWPVVGGLFAAIILMRDLGAPLAVAMAAYAMFLKMYPNPDRPHWMLAAKCACIMTGLVGFYLIYQYVFRAIILSNHLPYLAPGNVLNYVAWALKYREWGSVFPFGSRILGLGNFILSPSLFGNQLPGGRFLPPEFRIEWLSWLGWIAALVIVAVIARGFWAQRRDWWFEDFFVMVYVPFIVLVVPGYEDRYWLPIATALVRYFLEGIRLFIAKPLFVSTNWIERLVGILCGVSISTNLVTMKFLGW